MDKAIFVPFCLFAGAFTIAGAVGNWDWFMLNRRARLFVSLFGRDGARVFYVGLGLIFIALGIGAIFFL